MDKYKAYESVGIGTMCSLNAVFHPFWAVCLCSCLQMHLYNIFEWGEAFTRRVGWGDGMHGLCLSIIFAYNGCLFMYLGNRSNRVTIKCQRKNQPDILVFEKENYRN